jgi:hypothetical protein
MMRREAAIASGILRGKIMREIEEQFGVSRQAIQGD